MELLKDILLCASLGLLFLLSAFFSACETVLFSLSPVQLQQIRERDAAVGKRLERLLAVPADALSTILVGNTLVNFAAATLGYVLCVKISPAYGAAAAVPVMTLLLLLLGEVTPKRLALQCAPAAAPVMSRILLFWMRLLKPVTFVLTAGSGLFKKTLRQERKALSDDELLTMVEVGEEQGALDNEEVEMVDGIMRLSELKASDEMVPRVDMIGIDTDTPLAKQLETARISHFHYLPVFNRTPDAIEGFVNTARFLLDPAHDLRAALQPAQFVPENMPLDDLLVAFQKSGRHVVCVLDEYGGTAGLITRSDILELIADPVVSPQERERPMIQPLHGDVWLIDGTTSLEEINRSLDLKLEADNADRLAGWVTFHAEHFPQPGERVEAQGCRATVRQIRRHRIDTVYLEILQRPNPEEIEEEAIEAAEHLVPESSEEDTAS